MFASDHQGKYPHGFHQLTPLYLKEIPSCLAAEEPSYIYSADSNTPRNPNGFTDFYHAYCSGEHHSDVGVLENYPQYDSIQGLIER